LVQVKPGRCCDDQFDAGSAAFAEQLAGAVGLLVAAGEALAGQAAVGVGAGEALPVPRLLLIRHAVVMI